MAGSFSFDIVSDYDIAEVSNSINQAAREISTRYDLKGTPASVELAEDKTVVLIKGQDFQLDLVLEIVRNKFAKRGVSQKTLDASLPKEEGNPWRWPLKLQKGLDHEKSKKITKLIRDKYPKVKTQIQGDAVRVTSSNKDDLQAVMKLINSQEFDFPVQFDNFR